MNKLKVFLYPLLVIAFLLTACATTPKTEEAEPEPIQPTEAVEEVEPVETEEEAQPTEEVEEAEPTEEAEEAPAAEAAIDGAAIYAGSCAGCHAPDRSGNNGPALLPTRLTQDAAVYVGVITDGRGGMPSFSNRLSAGEIEAVVEFILSEPQ